MRNKRPTHIEDWLIEQHTGQWFGWSNSKDKTYANLIIHDDSKNKPTEQECIDGLLKLQSDWDEFQLVKANARQSAINKLMALGLTEEEALALGVR